MIHNFKGAAIGNGCWGSGGGKCATRGTTRHEVDFNTYRSVDFIQYIHMVDFVNYLLYLAGSRIHDWSVQELTAVCRFDYTWIHNRGHDMISPTLADTITHECGDFSTNETAACTAALDKMDGQVGDYYVSARRASVEPTRIMHAPNNCQVSSRTSWSIFAGLLVSK